MGEEGHSAPDLGATRHDHGRQGARVYELRDYPRRGD